MRDENNENEDLEPPIDEQERMDLLQRDGLLLVIVLLCLANGMHFSPLYDYVLLPLGLLTQSLFQTVPIIVTYITSLLLSTATMMISGIPAALYERRNALKETNSKSCVIWMIGAFLLALPSLLTFSGVIG